jgi:branched-chain amino acid transport system permease protein
MPDPLIYVLDMLVMTGIFAILSISLNLEYGFTGMANFGKVAFFMMGAYASSIAARAGAPFIACIAIAIVVSGLTGLLASLPALRLREDYLAIVTLTFGEILRFIIKNEDWIGGGVWGLTVPPAFTMPFAPSWLMVAVHLCIVYLALAACYVVAQLIVNSPYGRVMRAIREDELAAQVLGKNTVKYKAQVFMLGSAMAGVAGSLFAQYSRFIDPYTFMPILTFTVWMMVVLGGPGNNTGVILGAFILQALERGTRIVKDYLILPIDPHNLRVIMIGTLIILILFYMPQGLLKEGKIKTPALGG